MEKHAERYSAGYRAHKGYTFWEKDFDAMAFKTMLRQLISKWGIMSIDMQTAYTSDMTVIDEQGNPNCADNSPDEMETPAPAKQSEAKTEPQPPTQPQENTADFVQTALFGEK